MNHLFIGGIISFEWVTALCWTLLHSIWQGMLAAVLAGIIILCTKRSKAVIRYNLLCIVFISFIIGSAYTFLHQPSFTANESSPVSITRVDRIPSAQVTETKNKSKLFWNVQKERFLRPVIYYTNKYSSFIAGIWAIFFLIHFIKMIAGLRYVHNIRTRQTHSVDREWKERLLTISRMLGIRKLIGFKESALIKVPVVIGFFKPVILVPLGMFANLSAEQVETILVHELAHVRRRDFMVNLLQRFAEAVFFFNPFIAWISFRIREEREACCDDIVMDYTSDRKIYVEALVSFRQPDFAIHSHAMALAGNNNLLNRVKRMITKENKKLNAMEKLTLILVVLALTAFSFIPARKNKTTRTELLHPKVSVNNPVNEIKTDPEKRPGTLSTGLVNRKDTVPTTKQVTLKNISQSFNEGVKETTVTAVDGNGKRYSYKKINDDIISLEVDGNKIDRQNVSLYNAVIEKIETAIDDMAHQSIKNPPTPPSPLTANLDLIKMKELSLQDQQMNQLKGAMDLQNNILFQKDSLLFKFNSDNLLNEKNQLMNLMLKGNTSDGLLELKGNLSALANEDIKLSLTSSEINRVINDLAGDGIIGDSTNLSLSLNYDEMIVNGRKQSGTVHEKFKKKYILHKKDHIKFTVSPKSRSTDIYTDNESQLPD